VVPVKRTLVEKVEGLLAGSIRILSRPPSCVKRARTAFRRLFVCFPAPTSPGLFIVRRYFSSSASFQHKRRLSHPARPFPLDPRAAWQVHFLIFHLIPGRRKPRSPRSGKSIAAHHIPGTSNGLRFTSSATSLSFARALRVRFSALYLADLSLTHHTRNRRVPWRIHRFSSGSLCLME